jgi:hypothetical protein
MHQHGLAATMYTYQPISATSASRPIAGWCAILVSVVAIAGCAAAGGPRSAPPADVAMQPTPPDVSAPAPGLSSTALAQPQRGTVAPVASSEPGNVASGFVIDTYLADPGAYCRVVDGSRCNEVAQPGPTTPVLLSVGAGSIAVPTGGSVQVQAQTAPGMPVSFTSQGLGEFPASGQSAITVAADAAGVATAVFRASPGTVGHCLIIAGSPVRAGTVTFLVNILE